MARAFAMLLAVTLTFAFTHKSFAQFDIEKEQLARWQLNNAELLIDEGKYLEAIEFVNSAFKLTQHKTTRKDALLKKALLFSMFLDEEKKAIGIYEQVQDEFPKQAELALFRQALLYLELTAYEQATKVITAYKRTYPEGRYLFQLDAVLKYIQEVQKKPSHVDKVVEKKLPVLRVALAKRVNKVVLEAFEGSHLSNGQTSILSPSVITYENNRMMLNKVPVSKQLVITSSKPITVFLNGRKKIVRGSVVVQPKSHGMLVLNRVNIEDYLLSVVPSESYPSWPEETLKAQAIAARTYAYYQKLHRRNLEYDVRADTFDQMYGGVAKEHPRTTKAIKDTRGVIIAVKKKPILAQYTANSGGYSADAGAIFNTSKPYLIAHPDPKSLKGKLGSWSKTFTLNDVEQKLSKIGIRGKKLVAITPNKTGPSGRVVSIKLKYADKTYRLNTRTTLASSKVLNLPDILFEVHQKGDSVVFHGHGHGHGVGLSQWGSAELGKSHSAEQILSFYYPTTSLHQRWQ